MPRKMLGAAAAAVAAEAPAEATLVVTTPGVLAHVAREGRDRIIEAARVPPAGGSRSTTRICTPHCTRRGIRPPLRGDWPADAFALALDGRVLAAVDPLGGFVEWRSRESA